MGEVYRARDPRLARDVAIKLIPETLATDTSRVQRFEQEARAAGQLNHPNILVVYDVGTHAGAPFIVSELLEGESLRGRLHGGAFLSRKAIDYARQIAEGLAAAHARGIVHRDLKPDNLFITNDGRVKILDFGIAKLTRPGDDATHTSLATETEPGMVVGTAGYMSPEQVRGEAVDARSDLFTFGAILYEMLGGRPAFSRETAAETMTAVLKEDPPAPLRSDVPALERIVARCLEKNREARFQSARDLAFALDVLSGTRTSVAATPTARPRWPLAIGIALVALSIVAAAVSWLARDTVPAAVENPLANANFAQLTDWEGTEQGAVISQDGRFVAFLADREGQTDLWVKQVGAGEPLNLTRDVPPLESSGSILRKLGFSGDGSEIWFLPDTGVTTQIMLMPLIGGTRRPFLALGATAPSWSPDHTQLAFFVNDPGDPLFVAGRTGADPRQLLKDEAGIHNHNPVWSPDGQWIYYVHGREPLANMEIWRIRPSGGSPEQLTAQKAGMNYLAPIGPRTLLYTARLGDRWELWSLDVEQKTSRRVSSGPGQYTAVSASLDGRRVVATISNARASLSRVPILARRADDRDVQPLPLPTMRAHAPRIGGASLFYLSASGTADGLWRFQNGQTSEVWRAVDGTLSEPAAVSPDGRRVAVLVRQGRQRRLEIVSVDGTNPRTLGVSIDIQGEPGQGAVDWSPDGKWIVTGGSDTQGPGLFRIDADTGATTRLFDGQAANPVWSPDGKLIVYGGAFVAGQVDLLGIRPDDGTAVKLPSLRVGPGRYRFLPDGTGLIYLVDIQTTDFWRLDFATGKSHQLALLSDPGTVQNFDITPDGKEIVFDRLMENSDIYLIDLAK